MVTTVGSGSDFRTVVENMIMLEHDAIAAYTATIERLESTTHKTRITEFRGDHERHLRELHDMARSCGANIPTEGDMKQMLTTGKVKLANLMGGDSALLKAMSSNENDTIQAYQQASENSAVPAEHRPVFQRGLEDERKHQAYMDSAAQQAA
jgi:predicted outer membrane protein